MPALVIPRESCFVPARARHLDALALLRLHPTAALLSDLRDHRRDARAACPPMRWLDGAMGAMRVRRVLRERGHAADER